MIWLFENLLGHTPLLDLNDFPHSSPASTTTHPLQFTDAQGVDLFS
jgi:hypothetical protein